MTLLLGMMNRRQAVLLADRRLTVNGRLVDDESNKAATLVCRDARLAVAFTGLARAGSFVTRRWLLDALAGAAEPECLVKPLLDRFTKAATETFRTLRTERPSDKRLTVLCVGYVYDETEPRGMLALISNFEGVQRAPALLPEAEFTVEYLLEKRPAEPNLGLLMAAGMEHALTERDFAALQELLRADKPANAVVGKALESLRKAADSPAAHKAIGKQCSSVVLPSNPEEAASVEYHSAVRSHVVYGVSHVEARGGEFGIYEIAEPESGMTIGDAPVPLRGPRLRRNEPCWCGAKHPDGRTKKYKHCHGR